MVMGSADKMIFYVKEMVSDLNFKPEDKLDPFVIAKMDLKTIDNF